MATIECVNLNKDYENTKAITDLSFTIEENTITGLIGRNGAGKTTLLKIIKGFIKPTSGDIKVFGTNPFDCLSVSANSFFTDDNMEFPSTFNLSKLLEETSKFYPNWDSSLAKGLFDYFGLNPKQYHGNLSKGQNSTFNMIVALSSHSALTIFDEPTSGMDASVRKDFYRALLKDYLQYPRTIIVSSHMLSELEGILENILLIKNGTKVLHLPVDELKEMAIGLKGDISSINTFIENKAIIHSEKNNGNQLLVVVKNDFSKAALEKAKLSGIEILPVSIEDLCVYLTAKSERGIDDVFDRTKRI
ncbi:MAG TPA: ABC transporter ATP-binding protein [Clostridiaceae bacterium]